MAKKSAKSADVGGNGSTGFSSSADTAQKPVNGAKTDGVFDVGKTDYTKWRLLDEAGRQTWHYLTDEQAKEWPQSFADKYFLNMRPLVCQVSMFLESYANVRRMRQSFLHQKTLSTPSRMASSSSRNYNCHPETGRLNTADPSSSASASSSHGTSPNTNSQRHTESK
jgi:hypothetical protein